MDDPDVPRLWLIGQIAKEFGMSPMAAARELDNDPDGLALLIMPMLRYHEAFSAFKQSRTDAMKAWSGNKMMERVVLNAHEMARERLARAAEQ